MISTHSKPPAATDEREKSIGFLVHEVAKLLKRRFDDEARLHGLTLAQWRVLVEVMRNEGITQVQLANCTDTDPMTMSGILDRLEKRGLIQRTVDPNDSRAKRARLTPDGHSVVETARNVGRGMYRQALDGVTDHERMVTLRALQRIRDNLVAMDSEHRETV